MLKIFYNSVALRFATLLSIVIIIALSVLVSIQIKGFQTAMRHEFEVANIIKTQLLATQMAGGIKWKKADVIEAVYADVGNNESSGFVSAYVFHRDDGKLSTVRSSKFDAFDFDAFLEKTPAPNNSPNIQNFETGGHHIVYAPVIDLKKQEYLGGLLIAWSKAKVNTELANSQFTQIITSLTIVVGLIILVITLLRFMIVSPLKCSIGVMSDLAQGDYDIEIPDLKRRDEIGVMARAVEVFKRNAIEKKSAEFAKVEAEKRMEQSRKATMDEMARKFESEVMGIVNHLLKSITQIGQSSKILFSLAQQTESKATDASGFSIITSQNVQSVASASEELSLSVKEIITQVLRSSGLTRNANEQAQKTNRIVSTLQDSTKKIGEVVRLIQDIAEQTNLLALNATIEAARAGDAGKGFAVVANEVKLLANETARATEEISERVQEIRIISEQSSSAIQVIVDAVVQANESMSSVASAIEEQGAATQEISRSVQEVATGTNKVSESISSVNSAAVETGKLVSEAGKALEDLLQQSDLLKFAVNEFISNIRAT